MNDDTATRMERTIAPVYEERPMKDGCVHDELLPEGSIILFHSCRQTLLTLNPTAALVWECCDGEHRLADIVAEVREVFPAIPTIEQDVLAVLRDLYEAGVILD